MAEIPAGLKPAEIGRFIHRANQLRQVKPTITYYCEYYAINQILEKHLHQVDQECLAYTTGLMDKLEQFKSEHAGEDVLVDDTVGRIYVEEFAHETFNRAEKVLRANRVTRNTADAFDAAATFFELAKIWGPPDEETQKKIKFAKWNAARILKAIKEGQDPNESNPRMEEPSAPEPDGMFDMPRADGAISPGMGTEMGPMGPMGMAPGPNAPDMEGRVRQDMGRLSMGEPSPLPPKMPLGPSPQGLPPQPQGYFAPPEPAPPSPMSAPSIDGGNAPDPMVPSPYSHPSASPAGQPPFPGPPSAPASSGYPSVPPGSQPVAPPHMPPSAPSSHGPRPLGHPGAPHAPQPHIPPHMSPPPPPPATQPHHYPGPPAPYPPSQPHQGPSPWPPARPPIPPPTSMHQPSPSPYGSPYHPHSTTPNVSVGWHPPPVNPEADIDKAQKHAKYAQSALTFDDVPTAVKELRLALAALGVHQ